MGQTCTHNLELSVDYVICEKIPVLARAFLSKQ